MSFLQESKKYHQSSNLAMSCDMISTQVQENMLDDSDEDEEGILAQIHDLQAKLKKSKSRKRVQKAEEKELTTFEKMKMDEELHVLKQQVEDDKVQ